MPHGHRHPLSIMQELATDVFIDMGYTLVDGVEDSPEIENDYYCFEALNCPKDHPARDMQVCGGGGGWEDRGEVEVGAGDGGRGVFVGVYLCVLCGGVGGGIAFSV